MKISFIAHASILIETNGLRILSDPWWKGPCFGAQWWVYPGAYLSPVQEGPIDYIYISHGHHDHFHPGTLRTLSRQSKILVAKGFDIAPAIRDLGFEVIEVAVDEERDLGSGVKVRIEPTYHDDSLLALSDSNQVCVNLNDSLHAAPTVVQDKFIDRLKTWYPRGLDYIFCGYGIASHFPNCYLIPGKNGAASAGARQKYFNTRWARIMGGLEPKFGFPFAADVVFLEESLFWANEPTHNTERPTAALLRNFPNCRTQVVDIAPGFTLQDHEIVQDRRRKPVSNARLKAELPTEIEKANRFPSVSDQQVEELAALLRQNIEIAEEYLITFPGEYSCLIEIRNASAGIEISKSRENINVETTRKLNHGDYDLIYTTRFPYLKNSLVTEYGSEVLFVGSGGLFEYTDRSDVKRGIHRELMLIIKRQKSCPAPRYGGSSHFTYKAKQAVKKVLSMQSPDLYDVNAWTVYEEDPTVENGSRGKQE